MDLIRIKRNPISHSLYKKNDVGIVLQTNEKNVSTVYMNSMGKTFIHRDNYEVYKYIYDEISFVCFDLADVRNVEIVVSKFNICWRSGHSHIKLYGAVFPIQLIIDIKYQYITYSEIDAHAHAGELQHKISNLNLLWMIIRRIVNST